MKKENKCFDPKHKQKKHYEKWKKLIKNLSNSTDEKDKQNEKKEKTKTFEDFFPIRTITKCYANRMDYKPFLEGA